GYQGTVGRVGKTIVPPGRKRRFIRAAGNQKIEGNATCGYHARRSTDQLADLLQTPAYNVHVDIPFGKLGGGRERYQPHLIAAFARYSELSIFVWAECRCA